MEFLQLFRGWKQVENFDTGSVIYSADNPTNALYVILDGEVELRVHDTLLTVECKGGIIGEMALLAQEHKGTTAHAVAATPVRVAVVHREDIKPLVAQSTEFSLQLMSVLTDRLRALDNYISERMDPEQASRARAL